MSVVLERPAERAHDRVIERLYRRHRRDVYRAALAIVHDPTEAEDVTQTTFLNAYRALEHGQAPAKPRAWLLAIAGNVCRRRFRMQRRRPHEVELDADAVDSAVGDEDAGTGRVGSALAALRPAHRDVLVLRELEGLSYAEIAGRLGLSHSAVEALLFRARRALREELEGEAKPRRRRGLAGLLPFPALVERLAPFARPEVAAKVAAASLAAGGVAVVGATGAYPPGSAERAPAAETARPPSLQTASQPGSRIFEALPAVRRRGENARAAVGERGRRAHSLFSVKAGQRGGRGAVRTSVLLSPLGGDLTVPAGTASVAAGTSPAISAPVKSASSPLAENGGLASGSPPPAKVDLPTANVPSDPAGGIPETASVGGAPKTPELPSVPEAAPPAPAGQVPSVAVPKLPPVSTPQLPPASTPQLPTVAAPQVAALP